MNQLAILVPALIERQHYLDRLMSVIQPQIDKYIEDVVVIVNSDNRQKTTGEKRNELVLEAIDRGFKYAAHFDQDDIPSKNYVEQQLSVCYSGLDCGSLLGSIYFDGVIGRPFHHSIEYNNWFEDKNKYARCPNHLNTIKLDILKHFPFPDKTIGEDGVQSLDMAKAQILKTQHNTQGVIYHYFTGQRHTELEKQIIKSLMQ